MIARNWEDKTLAQQSDIKILSDNRSAGHNYQLSTGTKPDWC